MLSETITRFENNALFSGNSPPHQALCTKKAGTF